MSSAAMSAAGLAGSEPTVNPSRVTCVVEDGIADVRLNRPEKLNALDQAMFDALAATGDRLAGDPDVRAVVLSGEGRGFCAGLDVGSFHAMASPERGHEVTGGLGAPPAGRITNLAQHVVHVWTTLAVPVIAAIHGAALGGGLQLALGADVRIVSADARLSVLEIRWGLIPDMTGTWVLPRLIGLDRAKELTWTGRVVDGAEAVQIGLATRLADDARHEAMALARQLAASSPQAIRAAKALLNRSLVGTEVEQYQEEWAAMSALIGSPDQREAVNAYFEKRAPVFGG